MIYAAKKDFEGMRRLSWCLDKLRQLKVKIIFIDSLIGIMVYNWSPSICQLMFTSRSVELTVILLRPEILTMDHKTLIPGKIYFTIWRR